MAAPIHLTGLTDREACIDAFLRSTQGLDSNNEELLQSAWTDDAVLDLTGVAVIGIPFGTISTREVLVPHLLKGIGSLDSLHHVINWRVNLRGNTAYMTGDGLAQHYPSGHGPDTTKKDYLLVGNRYKVD